MKKLSTMLLVVLMSVICVLSVSAADFLFWDFTDEDVVAQWNPNSSTNVEVTSKGARIYGTADSIGFTPDFLSDVVLDNYQYVVIEYTGATHSGRMQFYHNHVEGTYYYLQRDPDTSEGVHRFVFDFESGDIGNGPAHWTGNPNFLRFDVSRGTTEVNKEITIKYIGFFANKAQFDNFNLADVLGVYRDSVLAKPYEEAYVGDSIEFTMAGPIDFAGDESYVTNWYGGSDKDNCVLLDETSRTLNVTPEEAGTYYYYAVVTDVNNDVYYESDVIEVTVYDPIYYPIVYDAETLFASATNGSSVISLKEGGAEDGVNAAINFVPTSASDPGAHLRGLNVDLRNYTYMVLKIKTTLANSMQTYHYFNRSTGSHHTGASASYYQQTDYPASDGYQYIGFNLNVLAKDPTATVYTGMRFDFFNTATFSLEDDSLDLEYLAFFTDKAQFEQFKADSEEVIIPDPEGQYWQFANDASFSQKFFADAEYVEGKGAKLLEETEYIANLSTKDKFDLQKYAVVKIFYDAAEDADLTIYNNGVPVFKETLDSTADSATFDYRTLFPDEFSAITFYSNANITISAIGFFASENDASTYFGDADVPTADGDVEYDSAIWWNFANTGIYYKLQAVNADRAFNVNDVNGLPNTITLTAVEDGTLKFSYSKIHMMADQIIKDAEQTPYITVGYASEALEGKSAYLKFKSERYDEPVVINFTWPAEGDDLYNGCLLNLGKDTNGYTKLFIDLASINSLLNLGATPALEWRGTIEYVEIGVDALTAGDAVEIAYINFFEFDTHAKDFDGKVILPPSDLIAATWKSKSVVIAEYITVDDMDLEAEEITFAIKDYSRISRLTLNELKKNVPAKKIVVDGEGYDIEFYPKNVSDNMKTWYYDLEVSFDGTNSGDVYHETIKELITEGEYINGVYFYQKFMKDRSMPFKGKLIYEIGEVYNDKYLDIYKYDPATNTVELVEHAPVKEGKITINTLGGDLAIVDNGYQPSEEELKRAEAIDVYENTPWNALIFDFGAASGDGMKVTANNADVTTDTKAGVTYKSVKSTKEGTRIELKLTPATPFEASEYPVMIVKYKTSTNLTGSVNNYVTTDYYAGGTGYEWFNKATFYSATGVYAVAPNWTSKILNYTNGDTMKASGFAINGEYTEGKTANGSVAYPFKGKLSEYRLDFNVSAVGTTVDIAYVAFFADVEEAQKYLDARNVIDGFASAEAKAEEEAAKANRPQYYVFDLTDEAEARNYTYASASESQPTKTESKQTKEGLWMKDDDAEFNITRVLAADDQFELADYPILKIKVKYSIPGVTSQLYLWNDAQVGINPRCELLVEKGGEWTEQIWDYTKENMALGTWNGNLTKFRLDPMRGAGRVEREATIAYIGFFKTVEDAEAFDGKVEKK